MELIFYLALAVGINIAMFIPAFILKTDRFTDISYALSFIILTLIAFFRSPQDPAHIILTIAICAWAVRLGGFLLFRIWKTKRDKRFDGMREDFFKFLRFWLLQGVSVFVVMVSSIIIFEGEANISWLSWLGFGIFLTGLLIESTADIQKYKFNVDKANNNKWIASGLWGLSRHPNYLGEMMVWIGLYIFGFTSLSNLDKLVALLSPIYIIDLLLFASGVPLLEKAADKKWGNLSDYQEYKKTTPLLIPRVFKKNR